MIPCEVINLSKKYGKTVALKDFSVALKQGEILGLIGSNGAGKTTTINALVGLVVPDSGDVALFQQDAQKHGHTLRKEVGFASSEASYFPNLTVRENLEFVADVKQVPYDRIGKLAAKLELNLSQKAKNLSLGNKKKLALVSAFLSSPKVIVLDEPTDGLDPLVKQSFLKLVEEEKARGASIIISSHALTDVQRLCDRVAIISKGKLIAVEQMQQLKLKRLKNVVIETKYSSPEIVLSGVSSIQQEGSFVKFNYNGEMKKLITYINSLDVVNVQINDADLESIFLHFYE